VVTLRQVWAAWKEGGLLPSHPIVISFDTGYHSVFAKALPLMRGYDWPGTLFLKAGQPASEFPDSEVKQLVAEGWELGTEGRSGEDPTGLSDDQLNADVTGARQTLQSTFGVKVEFFAYPQGSSDDRVRTAVKSAGYLGAVTLEPGLATQGDPFQLNRIPVQNGDGVSGLAEKLQSTGLALTGAKGQ
jgi:peptidoglycan/xylan/chitin deacetylase (PgdA/CDA1 family)